LFFLGGVVLPGGSDQEKRAARARSSKGRSPSGVRERDLGKEKEIGLRARRWKKGWCQVIDESGEARKPGRKGVVATTSFFIPGGKGGRGKMGNL